MAEPSSNEPLLNLDTLIVREAIVIDDVRFEILSAAELSVLASHRFGIQARRIEELSASLTDQDSPELEELVTEVARAVLVDVPDEVFTRLSGAQRMAIVDVFTVLLLRNRLMAAGAIRTAMAGSPTGVKTSLGSSGSTADRRNGGWMRRLLRWFGRTG